MPVVPTNTSLSTTANTNLSAPIVTPEPAINITNISTTNNIDSTTAPVTNNYNSPPAANTQTPLAMLANLVTSAATSVKSLFFSNGTNTAQSEETEQREETEPVEKIRIKRELTSNANTPSASMAHPANHPKTDLLAANQTLWSTNTTFSEADKDTIECIYVALMADFAEKQDENFTTLLTSSNENLSRGKRHADVHTIHKGLSSLFPNMSQRNTASLAQHLEIIRQVQQSGSEQEKNLIATAVNMMRNLIARGVTANAIRKLFKDYGVTMPPHITMPTTSPITPTPSNPHLDKYLISQSGVLKQKLDKIQYFTSFISATEQLKEAFEHPGTGHTESTKDMLRGVLGLPPHENIHYDIHNLCGVNDLLDPRNMVADTLGTLLDDIAALIQDSALTEKMQEVFRREYLEAVKKRLPGSTLQKLRAGFYSFYTGGPANSALLVRNAKDAIAGRTLSSFKPHEIHALTLAADAWNILTRIAIPELNVSDALLNLGEAIANSRASFCDYVRSAAMVGMVVGERAKLPENNDPNLGRIHSVEQIQKNAEHFEKHVTSTRQPDYKNLFTQELDKVKSELEKIDSHNANGAPSLTENFNHEVNKIFLDNNYGLSVFKVKEGQKNQYQLTKRKFGKGFNLSPLDLEGESIHSVVKINDDGRIETMSADEARLTEEEVNLRNAVYEEEADRHLDDIAKKNGFDEGLKAQLKTILADPDPPNTDPLSFDNNGWVKDKNKLTIVKNRIGDPVTFKKYIRVESVAVDVNGELVKDAVVVIKVNIAGKPYIIDPFTSAHPANQAFNIRIMPLKDWKKIIDSELIGKRSSLTELDELPESIDETHLRCRRSPGAACAAKPTKEQETTAIFKSTQLDITAETTVAEFEAKVKAKYGNELWDKTKAKRPALFSDPNAKITPAMGITLLGEIFDANLNVERYIFYPFGAEAAYDAIKDVPNIAKAVGNMYGETPIPTKIVLKDKESISYFWQHSLSEEKFKSLTEKALEAENSHLPKVLRKKMADKLYSHYSEGGGMHAGLPQFDASKEITINIYGHGAPGRSQLGSGGNLVEAKDIVEQLVTAGLPNTATIELGSCYSASTETPLTGWTNEQIVEKLKSGELRTYLTNPERSFMKAFIDELRAQKPTFVGKINGVGGANNFGRTTGVYMKDGSTGNGRFSSIFNDQRVKVPIERNELLVEHDLSKGDPYAAAAEAAAEPRKKKGSGEAQAGGSAEGGTQHRHRHEHGQDHQGHGQSQQRRGRGQGQRQGQNQRHNRRDQQTD